MVKLVDTLIMTGLPACGKDELGRYIGGLKEKALSELHLHPNIVRLDDFPYVHIMGRIDKERHGRDKQGLYFWDNTGRFRDPIDWGTLIHLINFEWADLCAGEECGPDSDKPAGVHILERLHAARLNASNGKFCPLCSLDKNERQSLADAINGDAEEILGKLKKLSQIERENRTVMIQLSRGFGKGVSMNPPWGYGYSFSQFCTAILKKMVVLHVEVTHNESQSRNLKRLHLNGKRSLEDGVFRRSDLHYGVPIVVLHSDYHYDDMRRSLIEPSGKSNRLIVKSRGRKIRVPGAVLPNNGDDMMAFMRDPCNPEEGAEKAKILFSKLKMAMDSIVQEEPTHSP